MAKKDYCDVQYTHFIWTVKYPNIFLGCDIRSPNFSIDSFGNTRFCVRLFSEKESEDYFYVSVYLAKHETYCGPNSIAFSIKLSITAGSKNEYILEDAVSFDNRHAILLERFASFSKEDYRCKGSLTLQLEIEPSGEATEGNLYGCNQQDLEMLSSDMNRALKSKRFCDLTLRSIEGTKQVSLHKCILAARYPKLATYFEVDKNDNQDCNLGVDFKSVSMLTQYLYSGSLDTGSATFGLHDILRREELDHLERVLYPTPRIIHASTSVSSKYGSFIWIIRKFHSLEPGKLLVNSLCLDMRLQWTKLIVLLYIRENAQGEECLVFKIVRSEQDGIMYMMCKISFVGDENGQHSKSYEHVFRAEREWSTTCFAQLKLIKENEDAFLFGDTLKLRLEFFISDLRETSEYESVRCLEIKTGQFSQVAMNLWALQRDLKSLYSDPTYWDCTLQVRGQLIPIHKVILSARSPEFSKMFESNPPWIVINDFDACVIKSLISYIYCGELPEESAGHIVSLYEAAHHYQVMHLREKCSRIMSSFFEVCTVGKFLIIADQYNDTYLKECVKDFVCSHADEVFESDEWTILKTERIDLTASIMNAAV